MNAFSAELVKICENHMECQGWGQWEAHMGYDRIPPASWTPEEQAQWCKGYDEQIEEQRKAA
jgi:hypothetical protein